MDAYPIAPEDCLILLAIKDSASLREAARRLNCDPAGLLRKAQRISEQHNLLQKIDGKWTLTDSGLALVGWTQESILSQKKLLRSESVLRIAATAWFAEQILIPALAGLKLYMKEAQKIRFTVPSKSFERALIEGDCDFVVVCHPPENPAIAHKQLAKEPWTIIVPREWSAKTPIELKDHSFIRHVELNPESIAPELTPADTNLQLTVDNLIGVRAAVLNGLGWSIVPRALVIDDLKTGRLAEIDHDLDMDRKVCIWWLRNGGQRGNRVQAFTRWVLQACSKILIP